MRLLLDTHTLLWFLAEPDRIPDSTLGLVEAETSDVQISIASLWEIALKVAKGKLVLPGSFDAVFPEQLRQNEMTLLDLRLPHVSRLLTLPFHHRDPFDRMLAAQSLVEDLLLVSADAQFDAYGVRRLWHPAGTGA